jgi:hypothetical protein
MAGGHLIGLIEKIVTSTPNCVRAVVSIMLLIAIVVAGLWLLNANVKFGPFGVTGRESPTANAINDCPDSSTNRLTRCAG